VHEDGCVELKARVRENQTSTSPIIMATTL